MSNALAPLDLNAPASKEAEEALLGAVLIDPEMIGDVAAIPLAPNDFFFVKHALIWTAMLRLYQRRVTVDLATLPSELGDHGMNQVGGFAALTNFYNATPSASSALFYADIIKRMSVRRQLMRAGDQIKAWAQDEAMDTEAVMSKALGAVSGFSLSRQNTDVSLMQAIEDRMKEVFYFMDNPNAARPGYPSSIKSLSRLLGQYQDGDLAVFGGLTSEGKSALMFAEIMEIAKYGHVAYFSLEMGKEKMADRAVQLLSGVSPKHDLINPVSPRKGDFDAYLEAVAGAVELTKRVHLEDVSNLTVKQFLTKARWLKNQYGCIAFAVDYIQIMTPEGGNNSTSRQQSLGGIAAGLKSAAKDLNAPVLTAAQLNDSANGQKVRPRMAHLREAKDIAMNADSVILIYRPDYREDSDSGWGQENEAAELIVDKNRDGARGVSLPVWWMPKRVAFGDRAPEQTAIQPTSIGKPSGSASSKGKSRDSDF